MRQQFAGMALATVILLAGCGSGNKGTLEITENGTYDVSGYSEVTVSVDVESDASITDFEAEQTFEEPADLNLTRVQFKYFSMEVPAELVEDYTDAELTENDSITLDSRGQGGALPCMILISSRKGYGTGVGLESITDAPQEDVGGIPMAIKHELKASYHQIEVLFITDEMLHRLDFSYPVGQDDLFSEYAEEFYRSVQLN